MRPVRETEEAALLANHRCKSVDGRRSASETQRSEVNLHKKISDPLNRHVLQMNCTSCHGSEAWSAPNTEADLRNGTHNGAPMIAPKNSAGSLLYQVVTRTNTAGANNTQRMPLGRAPLSAASVQALKDWIDQLQ